MSFFPTTVPTTAELREAKNNVQITLDGDINDTVTTIPVDDTSNIPSTGDITFADTNEVIRYTGKTANTITGAARGADGTAQASHDSGVKLDMRWNAYYHNVLAGEINAIAQYLSDRFGLTSNPIVPSGKTMRFDAGEIQIRNTNNARIIADSQAADRQYTLSDYGANTRFIMSYSDQSIEGDIHLYGNDVSNQHILLKLNTYNTVNDRGWRFISGKNADTEWGAYSLRIMPYNSVSTGDMVLASGGGRLRLGTGSADVADAITNFNEIVRISSTQFLIVDGSAAAPGLAFGSDSDLGIFRESANTLGISTGGGITYRFNTNEFRMIANNPIFGMARISLSSGKTTWLGRNYDDTGYATSGYDASQHVFSLSGSETAQLNSSGQLTLSGFGSAGTPGFSFTSRTNCGLYSPAANQAGLTAGGTDLWIVRANSCRYYVAGGATLVYTMSTTEFTPTGSKVIDSGQASGNLWDDIYADDFNNVADIPFFDSVKDLKTNKKMEVDDLTVIRGIQPAKDKKGNILFNENGHSYWDDASLPEWIWHRNKHDRTIISRDEHGKPWVSMKVLCGLAIGGVKRLEERVSALEAMAAQ